MHAARQDIAEKIRKKYTYNEKIESPKPSRCIFFSHGMQFKSTRWSNEENNKNELQNCNEKKKTTSEELEKTEKESHNEKSQNAALKVVATSFRRFMSVFFSAVAFHI